MGTTRVLSIQSSSELAHQEVAKTCLQRWQRCASRGGRDVPPEMSQNLHPELVRACASRAGKDMPPEVAEMCLQGSNSGFKEIVSIARDAEFVIVVAGLSGVPCHHNCRCE
ncbi:hypothetical protein F0562_018313 [Nyssa sinensis]|uniref:Uncharacterized protein n=1 Tax=Nyssa sinensis TaxID=561372 RepID=A0A5J4ZBP7_9ASTE|nr:hypothetical protein F0562_018313 [Nyssa sinensis]